MAVAFMALLATLGGTAVALPGKNGVKSDDIARNAVRSSDVRNSTLTTSDVKNSTLRGSDIRANTVTGADVDEGSLGTVPSASQANNANTATSATNATNSDALGGRSLRQISQWVLSGTGGNVVRSSGGVTVTKLGAAGSGRYRVAFVGDISNCAYNLTAGSSGDASDATDFADAFGMVGRSSVGAPSSVQVEINTQAGTTTDNPFYLSVQC